MARPRKHNRHLPPRMQLRGRVYYLTTYQGGKVKWLRLGDNFGDALRKYAELEGVPSKVVTIGGLIDRFLADHAPTLAEATRREYTRSSAALREVFGHLHLDELRKSHVARYLAEHPKKPQANHDVAMLSSMYSKAIAWGLFEGENPCKDVPRNRVRSKARAMRHDELQAIKAAASPQVRLIIELAYLTALRKSDLLKIRLADITPEGLVVRIQKTQEPILFEACPELDAIVAEARGLRRKVGSLYLFANGKGQPYTPSGFDSIFQRVAKKAGVSGVAMHGIRSLRLTEAARAHGKEYAQALAGHRSITMTEKYIREQGTPVVPLRGSK